MDIPRRAAVLAAGMALLLSGEIISGYLYWRQEDMELDPSITLSAMIGLWMLLPALMGFMYNLFEPGVQG